VHEAWGKGQAKESDEKSDIQENDEGFDDGDGDQLFLSIYMVMRIQLPKETLTGIHVIYRINVRLQSKYRTTYQRIEWPAVALSSSNKGLDK
jgi:hypothetical protein